MSSHVTVLSHDHSAFGVLDQRLDYSASTKLLATRPNHGSSQRSSVSAGSRCQLSIYVNLAGDIPISVRMQRQKGNEGQVDCEQEEGYYFGEGEYQME